LIPEESKESVVYGEHISRYLSVIDIVRDKNVLDIASGSGYGSQLLANYAKSVIGIDNSEEAVEYAKKYYPARNLKYRVADAHTLENIPDNSADVVVSMETIEHLPKPEEFVLQVKRVLKKSGVFIVSTPNDEEYREGNKFHVHEFTFQGLKRLMKGHFKNTDYYYQGNALAATLLGENEFSNEFRREMLVEKTIAVDPKKAIYFIGIATNSAKPPGITENIAISQHWNTKGFIEWGEEQQDKISTLEKRSQSLQNRLDLVEENNDNLLQEITSIKDGRTWSIAVKIQQLYRLFRYPRSSIVKVYTRFLKK